MDQTQLSGLDPKLKEAYDRVMGTANAANPPSDTTSPGVNSQSSTSEVFTPASAASTISDLPLEVADSQPTIAAPETSFKETVTSASLPPAPENNALFTGAPQLAGTDSQMHAYLADEVAGAKQSLKMIQLLYIGGGILFFVVYALFWMRFFQVTPAL
jgi:hypothetical protein